MRWLTATAIAAVLLTGCDPDVHTCPRIANCAVQIRLDGVVYREIGYGVTAVHPAGMAELASCGDVGPCARGAYFSKDPKLVRVWAVDGHPGSRVLALHRHSNARRAILVATSIPHGAAEQILAELGRD